LVVQRNEWDEDGPVGVKPVKSALRWRLFLAVAIAVGLIGASLVVPMPSTLLFLPGPVRDVERLVTVDGETTYSSEGRLYMTTVSVDDYVSIAEWVTSYFDPSITAVSEQSFTGGLSEQRLEELQKGQMTESKRNAAVVALGALGLAEPAGDGVRVTRVVRAPALDQLQAGDVVVAMDGHPTGTICDLLSELGAHKPGDRAELEVRRSGEKQEVDLTLGERPDSPGRPALGVELESNFEFDPGIDYEFKTGRIAGPSAGLMFALALYDRLTPDDLTAGHTIAGTGTIECDGSVGPIGGIEQKVAAAESAGAEVFLAPADNAAAAEEVADDIDIVSVERFEDAVEYLEDLS
jgi:Lon-like protease